jgi:hypothetical protein
MKKLFAVVMAALFACATAYAQTDAKKTDTMKAETKKTDTMKSDAAMNPQQNKMKTCQAEAGDKKLEGKARQDYVNECLKAKPAKAKSKMAECNAKTKGMKKEEADKARAECMKA